MARWIALFTTICLGMLAATVVTLWAWNGFHGLGMEGHMLAALLIGVFFTTVVGVGLMTLMFWSHRHRRDDLAHYPNVANRSTDSAWLDGED